jgi:hypothetical protein
MLLPAMVYVPTADELYTHFKTVAAATSLPIMLYNNPPAYRVSIELDTLEQLAKIPNIVALKESAPDPRRFTDIINRFGDRYVLMAGLDDVALEALLLGGGPSLIEALTYRHGGHSRADPGKYRPDEEVKAWKARDPIPTYRDRMLKLGIDDNEIKAIEAAADAAIDAAVEEAKNAPPPDISLAQKDVWADGGAAWRN